MTNLCAPAEVNSLQKEKVDDPTANHKAPHAHTKMQTPPGSSGQGFRSRSGLLAAPGVSSTQHQGA